MPQEAGPSPLPPCQSPDVNRVYCGGPPLHQFCVVQSTPTSFGERGGTAALMLLLLNYFTHSDALMRWCSSSRLRLEDASCCGQVLNAPNTLAAPLLPQRGSL
jgi:hypothetical protein